MNFKSGLIVVFVALAFFATIIFLDDSLLMLTVILLFMLGYSYFKWKNKNMAEEEIKAVVVSYIKPNTDWPSKITIPAERLEEIKISLAKRKIILPQATINKMVEDTLVREMGQRFESSFYAHNPDMSKDPGVHQWVEAYVMTFKRKKDYVAMLQRLMKKRGIRYPLKKLEEMIEEEIIKQEGNKRLKNRGDSYAGNFSKTDSWGE